MLDESWPGFFQEEILPVLPVEKLAPYFKEGVGRPTKDWSAILGVLLLQHVFDLTVDKGVTQFSYNIQWPYAFNVTEETDAAKYICAKTLWRMRQLTM